MNVKEVLKRCLHSPEAVSQEYQRNATNDRIYSGESMSDRGHQKPIGPRSRFCPITGRLL